MDFRNIKIAFLNNKVIKEKADFFRQQFWNNSIPVDIERIIELKLKINIIPIPGLQHLCNTDAFIDSKWQNIRVDRESYLDERYQNRLRFSLAHEIGHFVLHRPIYSCFGINTLNDFLQFNEQFPQEAYYRLELQAHNFANYLLVPRQRLAIEKEKLLKQARESADLRDIDEKTLNEHLAWPLSKIFGVSHDVIDKAFYLNSISNP